jgi:apolipoprotein N-acyltransferase
MMARVRAVENRRWLLRDTNNGYTVSVDPYGRIVAELAADIRGQLDAPYDFRTDRTLYSICGDWIAWLALLASIGIVGGAAVRFPRRVAAKMSAAGKPSAVGKSGASSHHRKSKLQDRQR